MQNSESASLTNELVKVRDQFPVIIQYSRAFCQLKPMSTHSGEQLPAVLSSQYLTKKHTPSSVYIFCLISHHLTIKTIKRYIFLISFVLMKTYQPFLFLVWDFYVTFATEPMRVADRGYSFLRIGSFEQFASKILFKTS